MTLYYVKTSDYDMIIAASEEEVRYITTEEDGSIYTESYEEAEAVAEDRLAEVDEADIRGWQFTYETLEELIDRVDGEIIAESEW